jgi:hypothetical protein
MIDKRKNRIDDLYKIALKLAQDDTQTEASIRQFLIQKACTISSLTTAKGYVDEVFARIDKIRGIQNQTTCECDCGCKNKTKFEECVDCAKGVHCVQ